MLIFGFFCLSAKEMGSTRIYIYIYRYLIYSVTVYILYVQALSFALCMLVVKAALVGMYLGRYRR